MKERPIIFNTAMVQAILAGKKTQTRRAVKGTGLDWLTGGFEPEYVAAVENNLCPFGQPGDLLWVRETFCIGRVDAEDGVEGQTDTVFISQCSGDTDVIHKQWAIAAGVSLVDVTWKPSIHMPRAACRLLLEVTAVRIERLQDISEDDAKAEGCDNEAEAAAQGLGWYERPRRAFRRIWESIYSNWDANPWVWVVEFKIAECKGKEAA